MLEGLIIAGVLLGGCSSGRRPPEAQIEDGLPRWKTHGDEVRLEVAKRFMAQGDTASTLEIIRQARAKGIESPELDLLQGKALRIEGVVTEAERLLLIAAKRMPRDDRPHAELCVLYAEEAIGRDESGAVRAEPEQISKAIEQCERAAKLDDTNARAWNNLAVLLLADTQFDEAGAAAQEAVKLDGSLPLYRNNLGLTQVARGKAEQGFRTFQSTMSRADAACMVGLASSRFFGDPDAEPWYRRAIDIEPRNSCAKQQLNLSNEEDAPSGAAEEAP